MAKALRTAALVVGAAALIVATGGAASAGFAAGFASTFGVSAASAAAIASATSGVLSFAAGAAAPKGTVGGNSTKFKIDKEAGIPIVMGRTLSGGNVVHRQYYNNPTSKMKNQLETWVTVLSLGPVKSVGPLLIDKTAVSFSASGAAQGTFAGNMWLRTQLGACPEPAALTGPYGAFPGWDASSKLSGLAADIWSLDFDSKGEKFPNGVPERGRVVEGIFAYDPRKDSTYPGGAGACRLGQPDTYVYSQNPAVHAITWAYGHYQNGVLMAGGGLPASGLDLAPFVEWANVCDVNKWTVGGLVYATTDDAWDVLKMICQAGAAEPVPVGAQLSVTFSAPRVSIGTITSNDIMGDVDLPATVSRRTRRNTIIPSVRLETHGWEMVPLDPVVVPAYVAIDGGSRPREVSYPLIQNATQGAQVALYDMLNARELDGIVVPAKVYALGYRPGDCITLQIPEANLIGREVVVRQREIDGSTMGATLTCRTEDKTKHDFALGETGTPPPTPDLSNPGIDRSAPDAADWSVQGTTLTADGVSTPALVITGTATRLSADEVIFDYRPYIAGAAPDVNWTGASLEPATVTRKEIASVTAATDYEVGVRYRMRGALSDRLILGPVTTGSFEGLKGENAPLVITQWSVDGVSGWHDTYTDGDKYQRQSPDNGVTWGPAVRVVGESDTAGQDGVSPSIVFKRSPTVPATPTQDTGNPPPGWQDAPYGSESDGFVWQSVSKFRGAAQLEPWSAPIRITGPAGQNGASAFTLVGDGPVVVDRNRVEKTGFEPAWDSSGRSLESWRGGAAATFRGLNPSGDAMAGLNSDPTSSAGFQSLDFAWWLKSGGIGANNCEAVINGSGTGFLGGAWDQNTTFQVLYDGRLIRWIKDGSQVYAVDAAPDMVFSFDSSILTHAAGFGDIGFVPAGAAGADGKSAPLVRVQWSIDGSTNWHDNYMGADVYQRQSNDNGLTWGPAYKVVGEPGDGPSIVFKRSATVPVTPSNNSGNPPSGWSDGPPAGTDFLWQSKATFKGSTQLTSWSSPVRISGEDGYILDTERTVFQIPVYASGAAKPSWVGAQGTIKLTKGGSRQMADVTYSLRSATNMASLTLTGDTFSFAGITADTGSFVLQATYNGQTYERPITVNKTYDGDTAFKGSFDFGNKTAGAGTTGLGNAQTPVPASNSLRLSAVANYAPLGGVAGSFRGRLHLYWQNVTDNGPLNYLGYVDGSSATTVNNGTAQNPDYVSTPGTVSAAFDFAGFSSDKVIGFSAQIERISGNFSVSVTGNMRLESR